MKFKLPGLWPGAAVIVIVPVAAGIARSFTRPIGVSWLPKIEMDSLDLIEKYVEAGYGLGLSVRLPEKKLSSKIRAIELPDLPPVKLGVLYRGESSPEYKVRRTFLEEVRKQAARFQHV